jgi:hypothetical protein
VVTGHTSAWGDFSTVKSWNVMKRNRLLFLLALVFFCRPISVGQEVGKIKFISLDSAQEVLKSMSSSLPPELAPIDKIDAAKWSDWVERQDREVRNRLDRGTEDTLTNLLRFGVTFTKEYRIDDEYLVHYGESSLVNAFAEKRADDLIRALASPSPPEGMAAMRAFLEKKGFSLKTSQDRAKVKKYLLANLARMRDDFLKYRAQTKDDRRFQLFQDRGISLDTNLWPDYQIDATLRELAANGLLNRGSMRRVAIIGPGLDFANKEAGNDFYPPQTIQPFAVLDSLFRLGLADPSILELYTLDISADVNLHIERWRKKAALGQPYVVQLPWNTERPMSEAYRTQFVAYWQNLGSEIGNGVPPIPVPQLAGATRNRAVKIRPQIVRRITPLDMNVVYQQLEPGPNNRFDLAIGTNIFLYYGTFEQTLARRNIAAMLKRGGYLLSNDKLPETVSSGLQKVWVTTTEMSHEPEILDYVFCYRRGEGEQNK